MGLTLPTGGRQKKSPSKLSTALSPEPVNTWPSHGKWDSAAVISEDSWDETIVLDDPEVPVAVAAVLVRQAGVSESEKEIWHQEISEWLGF